MKKILIGLAGIVLVGCSNVQGQLGYIGEEKAKSIATADLGTTNSAVIFESVKLESESGVYYYDVDFIYNNVSYDYDIDAYTGKIIAESQETTIQTTVTPTTTVEQANYIGEEKAKSIALAHAGVKESDVVFSKLKLDFDDDKTAEYDVEFYTGTMEYDYEINALTGEITSYDNEAESYVKPSSTASSTSIVISESEAKAIALKQVSGATQENIVKFEIDSDDGKMEYDGKIVYNNMEYEFSIDGYTGAIREWDVEAYDND